MVVVPDKQDVYAPLLKDGEVVVVDGGTGTYLFFPNRGGGM